MVKTYIMIPKHLLFVGCDVGAGVLNASFPSVVKTLAWLLMNKA